MGQARTAYADTGTHEYIVEPMTIVVDTAVGYSRRHCVSGYAISVSVFNSHKFGTCECQGNMA